MTIHPPSIPGEANNARTRSDGIETLVRLPPLRSEAHEAPRGRHRWSDAVSPLAAYIKDTTRGTLQRALDYCKNPRPQEPFWPDFPKLVALQSQLQGVLEKSTDTLVVAVDIKHSGTAVRDLITHVKHSSLVSKDLLAKHLAEFVEDACTVGRSLQKFGGRVERVVDQTISMNEYAIGLLESAAKRRQPSSFAKFLSPQVPLSQRKDIKAVWFKAIGSMKSEVMEGFLEATANMRALDKLENKLSVIHRMVVTEDNKIKADKAETLLKSVLNYREEAMKHVTAAQFQLERLDLDLNDLNEQVTTPLLEGEETDVPLDVHISVMQRGTARLSEGRARERQRGDGYMRKVLGSGYP
ncbi:hypothetical protein FRC10_009182 [Ceratobasidium sp. 414]|nr:hypothetical protein FRC10_009182 [Ceratobasidium sp. 414]